MNDSVKKRIEAIKAAEDGDTLRKHVCPFYEKGGHPDCIICKKSDAEVEECRDYYLERIATIPLDIWSEEFDKFIAKERDKTELEDVVGIGINCDSCYMSDKCPMFKRGYVCGIKWDTNKPNTPSEFMDFLINTQFERVKRASVFEKIDGGVPDASLSGEMDRLTDFLNIKDNMGRDRLSINLEASGAARPEGGGILAKLFGGATSEKPAALPTAEKPKEIGVVTEFEEVKEPVAVPRKRKVNNERSKEASAER